jgi:aminopeptidase N
MKLEVDIPDMGKPMLNGIETLTVTPIARERSTLELDAGPLRISSITIGGRAQKFTHERERLSVELSPPLRLGQTADLRIVYSVRVPQGGWQGPDVDRRARDGPQRHRQGRTDSQPGAGG